MRNVFQVEGGLRLARRRLRELAGEEDGTSAHRARRNAARMVARELSVCVIQRRSVTPEGATSTTPSKCRTYETSFRRPRYADGDVDVKRDAMLSLAQRSELVAKLRTMAPRVPALEPIEVHAVEGWQARVPEYLSALFSDAGWVVQIRTSILARETRGVVVYSAKPNAVQLAAEIGRLLGGAGFPAVHRHYTEPTDAAIIIAIGD